MNSDRIPVLPIIVESLLSILTILEFPDERLRKKAEKVETVDAAIGKMVDDMLETMYQAKGVGLAATQVNVQKRIVVIDVSEEKNQPLCFINPEIVAKEGVEESEEGCLSVPGFFEKVKRAERIIVKALDKTGQPFQLEADDLLAVCIQHELDHLEGKLFVDYLSPLKRQRIKKKLEKIHRLENA
jgi:peptide deformylase